MVRDTSDLAQFLAEYDAMVVLTGAGVSTASGIPDYRDRDGVWRHAQPIQFRDFMHSGDARRRYWARSFAGWPRFSAARPNDSHRALAALESYGKVDQLITQNVDRLHSRAGSRSVIDLHGDLGKVRCMDCQQIFLRDEHQERLEAANPGWRPEVVHTRPDGDAELEDGIGQRFAVPDCPACDGILKPDVVMFGESVPRERVGAAAAAVERADALLVVGSSLMVFSGFRFARQAAARGIPVAIVNLGKTRADDLATLKVEDDCTRVLNEATRQLPRLDGAAGPPSGQVEAPRRSV